MKVKMLVQLNGMRNSATYPPVGEVLELKDGDTAQDLLWHGYAELVSEPKPIIETAAVAPSETAVIDRPQPRKPGRPRKVVFPSEE